MPMPWGRKQEGGIFEPGWLPSGSLQGYLKEINKFRAAFGMPPRTLKKTDTVGKLQQELVPLRAEWVQRHGYGTQPGQVPTQPIGATTTDTTPLLPPPPTGKGKPRIESQGGFRYEVFTNPDGSESWTMIGEDPAYNWALGNPQMYTTQTQEYQNLMNFAGLQQNPMWGISGEGNLTPSSQWAVQQQANQGEQPVSEAQMNYLRQLAAMNVADRSQRQEGGGLAAVQKVNYDRMMNYENARLDALDQMTEPGDWLTRWQIEHTPNPYSWGVSGNAPPTVENVSMSQRVPEMGVPSWLPRFAPGVESMPQYRPGASPVTYQQGYNQPSPSEMTPVNYGGYQNPLTRVEVPPVSGQAWMATPYTKRQGLAGYSQYAGQNFQDILDKMAMMQTETPSGAGRSRWTPFRKV